MSFASTTRDGLYEACSDLLACVGEQLAETELGAPAYQAVVPGQQIAWDVCTCGQLTVHVQRLYPSDRFPTIRQTGPFNRGQCGEMTVAEVVVTILRCQPQPDDAGHVPRHEDMDEAGRLDFQDRWAVRRGVVCCFQPDDPQQPGQVHLLGEQIAVGEQGACAGSELHVFVPLANCLPCGDS